MNNIIKNDSQIASEGAAGSEQQNNYPNTVNIIIIFTFTCIFNFIFLHLFEEYSENEKKWVLQQINTILNRLPKNYHDDFKQYICIDLKESQVKSDLNKCNFRIPKVNYDPQIKLFDDFKKVMNYCLPFWYIYKSGQPSKCPDVLNSYDMDDYILLTPIKVIQCAPPLRSNFAKILYMSLYELIRNSDIDKGIDNFDLNRFNLYIDTDNLYYKALKRLNLQNPKKEKLIYFLKIFKKLTILWLTINTEEFQPDSQPSKNFIYPETYDQMYSLFNINIESLNDIKKQNIEKLFVCDKYKNLLRPWITPSDVSKLKYDSNILKGIIEQFNVLNKARLEEIKILEEKAKQVSIEKIQKIIKEEVKITPGEEEESKKNIKEMIVPMGENLDKVANEWLILLDPNTQYYYFLNKQTKQTQWEDPFNDIKHFYIKESGEVAGTSDKSFIETHEVPLPRDYGDAEKRLKEKEAEAVRAAEAAREAAREEARVAREAAREAERVAREAAIEAAREAERVEAEGIKKDLSDYFTNSDRNKLLLYKFIEGDDSSKKYKLGTNWIVLLKNHRFYFYDVITNYCQITYPDSEYLLSYDGVNIAFTENTGNQEIPIDQVDNKLLTVISSPYAICRIMVILKESNDKNRSDQKLNEFNLPESLHQNFILLTAPKYKHYYTLDLLTNQTAWFNPTNDLEKPGIPPPPSPPPALVENYPDDDRISS
jgi:hypothetical protein